MDETILNLLGAATPLQGLAPDEIQWTWLPGREEVIESLRRLDDRVSWIFQDTLQMKDGQYGYGTNILAQLKEVINVDDTPKDY